MNTFIFDFDGTLTEKDGNIWRKIWSKLGYETNENSLYSKLYKGFSSGLLSHKDWCIQTCRAFQKKGMKMEILDNISESVKLKKGVPQFLKFLKKRGYSLHIVSGNIKKVITNVLGENVKYFDNIVANEFIFDDGLLDSIKGTRYDFEGKADYVREYAERTNTPISEICFIGNGWNDEWVHQTGCKTICITSTSRIDYNNKEKWHTCVKDIAKLEEYFKRNNQYFCSERKLGR